MTRKLNLSSIITVCLLILLISCDCTHRTMYDYQGKWVEVEVEGNQELLELIDQTFESIQPSPQMANIALLYKRDWDGFVEATNWPCWWTQ